MSQQLDEKKYTIIPLLDRLREYNHAIGSYDRSVMNSNFNYSVKLSNGRIEIVEELVYDYERSPSHITEDRLKSAASKFVSDTPPQTQQQPTSQPIINQQPAITSKKKSPLKWIVLLGIIVIAAIAFIANQNSSNGGSDNYPSIEKSPEELRQELLSKEQENASEYLKHQGTWRGNLIGQTVLEGTISNSATLANFKDVVLEVTWLTKTETELKTELYTVYEFVGASKSVSYKIKVNAPSETAGVRIGISSATPAN